MANCSCSENAKVKPSEFCEFCVHKHLTTALSLCNACDDLSEFFQYRIASQIYLARLHLKDNEKLFSTEISKCTRLISSILSGRIYKADLEEFVANFWNRINNKPYTYPQIDVDIIQESSMEFAILRVSNVVELLCYEPSYEDVNYSTAIGELVLANWNLLKVDRVLAKQCRDLYHAIEDRKLNLEAVEAFKAELLARLHEK